MIVELISVGTELLLGNIVNTNAQFLSERCARLGLSLYYETTVGDNEERLSNALYTALSRSDIVILTGGLGPTADDMTKEVTAKILGLPLVEDTNSKEHIQQYFAASGRTDIPHSNWKQAQVIEGSQVIENKNGTAPGCIVTSRVGKIVILLPGPPNEMIPMFDGEIYPYLSKLSPHIFYSSMVKICGIGESKVEETIKDILEQQENPTIAPYAKTGEVHVRVTARADSLTEGEELVQPVVAEIISRFGDNIYTTEEEVTLEQCVVNLLAEKKLTLATAESCTGGLFSGRIVDVPGASQVYNRGYITYSNESKITELGVLEDTLNQYGAVSEQTAEEMAVGVANKAKVDIGLSITGLAGPDGGTKDKPVGLVYIACYVQGKIIVKEYQFNGDRKKIREYSVKNALDLLRRCILQHI